MSIRALLVAVMASAAAQSALAESTSPAQTDICANGFVDREKLAAFVLDAQHVSRKLDAWAATHPDAAFGTSTLQRVVGDETICATSAACVRDDQLHLQNARETVKNLLSDDQAYDNESGVRGVTAFFQTPAAKIGCRTAGGHPVEMVGVGDEDAKDPKLPLRIRGTADDLAFKQGSDSFKSASKANLSYSDDRVAGKRSTKIVADVGTPFKVIDAPAGRMIDGTPSGHDTVWIIPYGGIDLESSKADGKARSDTSNNWRLGVLVSWSASRLVTDSEDTPINNIIDARPEYVVDRTDGSRVIGIAFRYRPVLKTVPGLGISLNSFRPVQFVSRYLTYMPILDGRWVNGHFVRQGSRSDDLSHDYSRVGFEGGLALAYVDGKLPPINLRVTEDYLYGLAGDPKTLSQLNGDLGFSLDPEQMFGVDITYSRGRTEDLAERQREWSVALTIKY